MCSGVNAAVGQCYDQPQGSRAYMNKEKRETKKFDQFIIMTIFDKNSRRDCHLI